MRRRFTRALPKGFPHLVAVAVVLSCAACRRSVDLVTAGTRSSDAGAADGGPCPLAEGERVTVAVYVDGARARVPAQLATGGGDLYLLDAFPEPGTPGSASVFSTDACGGSFTRRASAGPYNVGGRPVLAASANAVFFGTTESDTAIITVARDGSGRRELVRGLRSLCALAFDPDRTRLVAARCGGSSGTGAIETIDPSSGQRTVVAGGRNVARGALALDARLVVWIEESPPRVVTAPLEGGAAPVEVYADRELPRAVALDEGFVYIATAAASPFVGVVRVPRQGGPPERIGGPQTTAFDALAVTSSGVFASGRAGIFRVDAAVSMLARVADVASRILIADGRDLFAAQEEAVGRAVILRLRPR